MLPGAKPDEHLDWSSYDPNNFLENLQEQPIRKMLFQRILKDFQHDKYSSILEVGFGGAWQYNKMRKFFRENDISYTGLEYSSHFVDNAQKLYPEATWVQGDVRNMTFADDLFDCVFLYHVLEHQQGYEDVQKAIKELCRVAKRRVIIVWFKKPTFAHETRGKRQEDGFFYYKYSVSDIWKAILSTDFQVEQITVCWNAMWDLKSKDYRVGGSPSSQEVIFQQIQENIQEKKFSTILGIGFGVESQSNSMRDFFRENSISFTGLEHTPHFVENAQKLYPEATWIYSDIHDMPFEDNFFDSVLVKHALESQKSDKEFDKTVKELCRVANKTIIVIWPQCPTIIKDHTEECDDEISASDTFKEFFVNNFQLKQITWNENCIWEFEPNDHQTY
jgi:ubiquinone/menaquinone biosynthesis C-methylase UbiE